MGKPHIDSSRQPSAAPGKQSSEPAAATATQTAPTATNDASYVRLHITPLDAELIDIVVPSAIRPRARNVSFHTIATFPEKRYGYVDLPAADGEKLRKKLNGSVLKGVKMKVEKARPKRDVVNDTEDAAEGSSKKRRSKEDRDSSKKRRRDAEVIPAVELRGRKVKRGWTAPEDAKAATKRDKSKKKDSKDKTAKKKEVRSKYTDAPEVLFKTKLPATAAASDSVSSKKRSKGKDREVVVHEFEKTTKFPTFLRSSASSSKAAPTSEFVEGQGWVDAEGKVVEKDAAGRRTRSQAKAAAPAEKRDEEPQDAEDETSSSGTSSESDSSSDDEPDVSQTNASAVVADTKPSTETAATPVNKTVGKQPRKAAPPTLSLETAAAGSSPSGMPAASVVKPESGGGAGSAGRPKSSGSLTIKIPPPETPRAGAVHPLEALYKRSRQDGDQPQGAGLGFTFFDGDDAMDVDADYAEDKRQRRDSSGPPAGSTSGSLGNGMSLMMPPMTPYTQLDFERRRQRSAAPTPDTAHPSRAGTFNFWSQGSVGGGNGSTQQGTIHEGEDEDGSDDGYGGKVSHDEGGDDESMKDDDDADQNGGGPSQDSSSAAAGFRKQFWESRGDLSRGWRKRRKTAAKEKRYRANKARKDARGLPL